MIEKSDYVIFYVKNERDSGANKALDYVKRRKKEYVNLFDENHQEWKMLYGNNPRLTV